MPTAISKEQVFALAAAFRLVQSAVSQATAYQPEPDDKIVFNALVKAMQAKEVK